jgi:tetratricopeptide (TPR) repeat protein
MKEEYKVRFVREAKAAAALNHSSICPIHEIDEKEGKTFISMAYIDGQSLAERITSRPLEWDEALRIAIEVAEGLEEAHGKGIVHRDIKCANIMVDEKGHAKMKGHAKIMDFGLAKLGGKTRITETAMIMGTVDYLSPEQARGEPVDHRTDIWSLGVVLYETLTGQLPFTGELAQAVIYSILNDEPKQVTYWNPDIPVSLGQAVRKMLHKEPSRRYETMTSLLTDLRAIMADATAVVVSEDPTAELLVERTPFVGRKKELADLRRFLDLAKSCRGALVLIDGEAGVGKSRIATELMSEARRREFLTLVGRCFEMKGMPPYIPFVEMLESAFSAIEPAPFLEIAGETAPEVAKLMPELRRRFPEIPPPAEVPPEHERWYLFNAIRELLARMSRAHPLYLIVEDLQWADEPTLLLLQHIVRQIDEIPVLIVGTYRDVAPDVPDYLSKVLGELFRQPSAHRVTLRRLPMADVSAMLKAKSGQAPPASAVRTIFNQTDGNPFFVEEVFKHLAEEDQLFDAGGRWHSDFQIDGLHVPDSIRLVIGHRLQRVPEECRHVLTAGAIVGRGFSFKLLKKLVALDEDILLEAIETAERAQLITSERKGADVRFSFFHDLIRQTLLSDLSVVRQQRLHLRAAEAIEQVHVTTIEEHAAELAHHFYQAGAAADPQKTVQYLRLAGDKAYSVGAAAEAITLYGQALSFTMADTAQAELLSERGMALSLLGRFDEALHDWRTALSFYERADAPEAVGNLCSEISRRLLWASRPQEAYEISSRGLAALGDSISAARCLLTAASGHVLAYVPSVGYEMPHGMFTEALDMARHLGEAQLEGSVLLRKAMFHRSYWQGPETAACSLRAAALLRPAHKPFDTANALLAAIWGLICVGRLDEAEDAERELETFVPKTGAELNRSMPDLYECLRRIIVTGDLEQLEQGVTAALEENLKLQWGWISLNYLLLGWAQFWRGAWESAEENLRKAFELMDPRAEGFVGYFIGPLLTFSAYAGRRNDAFKILEERRNLLPSAGQANTMGAWTLLEAAIESFAILGEHDEAAELYPLAREAVATGNLIRPSWAGLVQTMAGIAAAAGKEWNLAEEHFEVAVRQADELPHVIEQGDARRWYARMLIERRSSGDHDRAAKLLKEATAIYRKLSMPKHVEIAKGLMGKAGRARDAKQG